MVKESYPELLDWVLRDKKPSNGEEGWVAILLRTTKQPNVWVIFKTHTVNEKTHQTAIDTAICSRSGLPITLPGHFSSQIPKDLDLIENGDFLYTF